MILVFDFETTSLEISTLEVSQFAYTILNNEFKAIENKSFYVKANIDDTSIASQLTGIKYSFLQEHGKTQEEFLIELKEVYNKSDVLVAHNGKKFDFLILNRLLNVNCENEKKLIDTITDLSFLSIQDAENYKQENDFYKQNEIKKDYNKLRHLAQEILEIHIKKDTMHDASVDVFYLTSILQKLNKEEKIFLDNSQKIKKLKTYRVFFKDWKNEKQVYDNYKSDLKAIFSVDSDGVPIIVNNQKVWEAKQLQKTDLMLEKLKTEWKEKYGFIHAQDYIFRLEEEYQKDKASPFPKKKVEFCGVENKHKTYYEDTKSDDKVYNN